MHLREAFFFHLMPEAARLDDGAADVEELLLVGVVDYDQDFGDGFVEIEGGGGEGVGAGEGAQVDLPEDQLGEEGLDGRLLFFETLLEVQEPLLVLAHRLYK
jgi:hypothetical protein